MSEEPCEGFEIAIEMRRHGAADPEASRRLDEHLRGCAGCRAYEEVGSKSEARLRSDADDARATVDLERLRARGRRILGGIWSDTGAFFLLMSLAFMTRAVLGIDTAMATAQAILCLILPLVYLRRARRELEEAWSSETLFHAMRTDVDRRLKACVLLLSALIVVPALSFFVGAPDHGPVWSIARSLFSVSFGALGLFVLAVRVPQLLRERRAIPVVPDPYEFPRSTSTFGLP